MLEELGALEEALGEKHPGTVHASKIPRMIKAKIRCRLMRATVVTKRRLKEKALLEVFDRLNLTR